MSESRILLIDGDDGRAERVVTLLEFMDFNPRWVSECGDVSKNRRASDWIAITVGRIEETDAQAGAFFGALARDSAAPPILLLDGDAGAFSARYGIHAANVWPLDTPLKHAQLEHLLRRASLRRLEQEQQAASAGEADDGPTGTSPATLQLKQMIKQVAAFDTTVLLLGESGSGKEVAARAIHNQSPRKNGPFVAVNCGAIPADLLESELFGHEKGAFTGALAARKGRFELAEGGTLLLDEIGDMSMPMQVKLLRVLQERTFERVGGGKPMQCNVRVIAATHRNLERRISEGLFREDLFYRLNVFPIELPSLRERADDLPMLIDTIARRLEKDGRGKVRLAADALQALAAYPWPGNVRELSNLIERLAVLHPGSTVRAADLPARYAATLPNAMS